MRNMVTNFEEITQELNAQELEFMPKLISGFKNHTKVNPIKAHQIVTFCNQFLIGCDKKLRMTEPRLRKMCNYIRANGLLPLIATSEGYYVSSDPDEIQAQINSLRQRARSIDNSADGLERYLFNHQQKDLLK